MGVTAWFNTENPVGRFHLTETCTGLEHTNPELLVSRSFRSFTALIRADRYRRPCRLCALADSVVGAINSPVGSRPVVVAISSQPPITDWKGIHRDPTETGTARLATIATALNWPVCSTLVGPVTYGVTTAPVARWIAQSLATIRVDAAEIGAVNDEIVSMAWTLASDRLAAGDAEAFFAPDATPWELASAICAD